MVRTKIMQERNWFYHYLVGERGMKGRRPTKMLDENILIARYDFFSL